MIVRKKNWAAEMESGTKGGKILGFKVTEVHEDWDSGQFLISEKKSIDLSDLAFEKNSLDAIRDMVYSEIKELEVKITDLKIENSPDGNYIEIIIKK